MRRIVLSLMAVVALTLAGCTTAQPDAGGAASQSDEAVQEDGAGEEGLGEGEEEGRSGAEEIAEEANLTAERIEAADQARENGTFGASLPIENHATPGWSGEQLLNPKTDDWEPAVAADPEEPYVYLTTTRYGTDKTCPKHCPSPFIALTISKDGGSTWGDQVPLCVCRGSGAQYDPTIEVASKSGFVYSVFLNADRAGGFSSVFSKSTDHGKTWTDPVHIYGKVSWTDKPEVMTSPNGKHVYASWNGPQGGDLYVAASHDYGKTWTNQKLTSSKRYYYAYDGTVLPGGTVIFSESSLVYSGVGHEGESRVWHHAIISRDGGDSWDNVIVDKVDVGEACVAAGCSGDFYTGQTSITSDPSGHLVFAYEGPKVYQGPQRIYVRTSNDEGRTWGRRHALSVAGENATGPRLASGGDGDARVWYMQTANGDNPNAWNVWYRRSGDGGKTWGSPVKLSDATTGPRYKSEDGFREIYGDYGEIDVTSEGNTIAAWGEGFSYVGPGGTWFAVQD